MVTKQYNACKRASETFNLIVDTREQQNSRYQQRMEDFQNLGVLPQRRTLNVGDYSAVVHLPKGEVIDYTGKLSIERKMDLRELIACFGPERDRFEAELRRAWEKCCKLYVAIEGGSYADLVAGNYPNDHNVKNVLATYHTFEKRYGCSFVFVTPETFPTFVYETLRRYIMDDLCGKCRAKKLTVA